MHTSGTPPETNLRDVSKRSPGEYLGNPKDVQTFPRTYFSKRFPKTFWQDFRRKGFQGHIFRKYSRTFPNILSKGIPKTIFPIIYIIGTITLYAFFENFPNPFPKML
jgi:hypothetical protein